MQKAESLFRTNREVLETSFFLDDAVDNLPVPEEHQSDLSSIVLEVHLGGHCHILDNIPVGIGHLPRTQVARRVVIGGQNCLCDRFSIPAPGVEKNNVISSFWNILNIIILNKTMKLILNIC